MMQSFAERVYLTLNGQMEEWAQVPGVENEDADVESMINAFMDIERELCIRMFAYGAKLGTKA